MGRGAASATEVHTTPHKRQPKSTALCRAATSYYTARYLPREGLPKTSRKGAKNEPVLVTDQSSTGRAFDQYWLLPLTSTGHIGDQYWLIFSSSIEYRKYS